MSNGITPAQSTQPDLESFIKTRLFPFNQAISLEFYDRLMNLCNYEYPMTPDLKMWVERMFGQEMIHTIEQYRDLEIVRLSVGLKQVIRRIIPDQFYLEFIRLFDCDCCPTIIGEYNSILDVPSGTYVGQLAVERYIDGSESQHIHLYEWDGSGWINNIDSSATLTSGLFDNFKFSLTIGSWDYSIDNGTTWLADPGFIFDPPVPSITVWFRNTINGCIYTNLPLLPLAYCTDWAVIDGGNNFFFFGSVNGVTPPDQAGILATMGEPYQSVQGAFGGVVYGSGSNTIYLQVSRPTGLAVTASLATVLDENGDPVSAVPTNTTCTQNCYTLTQLLAEDPSTYTIDSITINGVALALTSSIYITDAGCADEVKSQIATYGVYDPQLSITIFVSGQNVTVQVLSILSFESMNFQSDLGELLNPSFSPCA